jgi:flagellar motor component MotA
MLSKLPVLAAMALLLFLVSGLLGGSSLWINLQSLALVLGGTLVCGLLAFPLQTVRDLLISLRIALQQDRPDLELLIEQIKSLARVRRTAGPRELSAALAGVENLFLRK